MAARQSTILSATAGAKATSKDVHRARKLIERVCKIAGDSLFVDDARTQLSENGVSAAVRQLDDGPVFDWMVAFFSFQGISNHVAQSYLTTGGGVTHAQVTTGLRDGHCPKLASFQSFVGCRYRKGAQSCAEPDHRVECPLPRHDLRNGRLNQTAYSFRLFVHDVCGDNLVGWIDRRLSEADVPPREDRVYRLGRAVIDPLKGVFGVSDKVLSMVLSELLIGADAERPLWIAAGGGMIAIDTLVHNWFHRTGLLTSLHGQHRYGVGCYGPDGCAALLRRISGQIDARRFNPAYPQDFPRFVQHAIWRFCALEHKGRCNGVQIDDRKACEDLDCPLGKLCARSPLSPPSTAPSERR